MNPLDDSFKPEWNRLIVGYSDPAGTGRASGVRAMRRRVSRPTGAVSTLATFDSNNSAATTRVEGVAGVTPVTFDFLSYEYFVQIELTRLNTGLNSNPLAYKVRLENIQCIS